MKLSDLKDNVGATKNRIRVGRGIGSGKGKTGGRGVKGQKARSGVAIKGFEGGQMPLHRRLPKRGFNNIFRLTTVEVTLVRIQKGIDAGKLDAKKPVDAAALVAAGVIRRAQGRRSRRRHGRDQGEDRPDRDRCLQGCHCRHREGRRFGHDPEACRREDCCLRGLPS